MLKKIWQKFKTWNLPTKLGIIISIVGLLWGGVKMYNTIHNKIIISSRGGDLNFTSGNAPLIIEPGNYSAGNGVDIKYR
jgi:hypothetical protein